MSRPIPPPLANFDLTMRSTSRRRDRSGSIVKVEQVGDRSAEEFLDRSAYVNINANWVNVKGAWLIHVVLILCGKIIIDTIPGTTAQFSWTLVNLSYLAITYLMFHWVTGIPFDNDLHGGAYDELTMWEQIDDGAQYTPAKKWLFSLPVGLFLASTHYTNYNPWLFAINVTALLFVLIPKLPQFHRTRVRFMPTASGVSTPLTPNFSASGANTPVREHPPPAIHITEANFR
ncbi:Orm1 type endoplasmic reticulum protein [Pterulicium gracile]|uniref:Orm1 type endoplasmic reticulum protein n=1 Tax=Pterulicium gracile TaxID=1884261 RepID=A0A5C3QUK4_9AGAR|nr:Orm1 type endoplasmic reticulum protein [Pterula gracilis]